MNMFKNMTMGKICGALGALLLTAGTAAANPVSFSLSNPGNTAYTGTATLAGSGSVQFTATLRGTDADLDVTSVTLNPGKGFYSRLDLDCTISGPQSSGLTGPHYDTTFGDKYRGCSLFWLGDAATAASGEVKVN